MLRCLYSFLFGGPGEGLPSMNPKQLAAGALALASSGDHESCPANSPPSCSVSQPDSCCYEGQNGLFLQTQFWDYAPATGPSDVWTIHGLWSDKCSGGYRQFCNKNWEISSAQQTLEDLGLDDLVSTMSTNWKNQGGSDNSLWTHEFNKHGTCMATVNPSCYTGGPANENVGDFFKSVVRLWETLPSYEWLADAGITPSTDKTYTVAEFSDVLAKHADGKTVYLGCDRNNAINEIWYFFDLKGSVADGTFSFIDSVSTSSCTDGFRYLPKGSGGGHNPGNPGDGNRGYLQVIDTSNNKDGCLISDGSWFRSGTCATYRVKETMGGVSISSSKGACGIVNGAFKCGGKVTASDFELDNENFLKYDGSTQWSADHEPRGHERESIFPGSGGFTFRVQLS